MLISKSFLHDTKLADGVTAYKIGVAVFFYSGLWFLAVMDQRNVSVLTGCAILQFSTLSPSPQEMQPTFSSLTTF